MTDVRPRTHPIYLLFHLSQQGLCLGKTPAQAVRPGNLRQQFQPLIPLRPGQRRLETCLTQRRIAVLPK